MPGNDTRMVENISEAVSKSNVPEGYVTLYTCQAWKGVSAWVNQVRVHHLPAESPELHILKINYCLDGRYELKIAEEGYFYIFEGQLSISSGIVQENYAYPTGNYDGVEILLRFDQMQDSLLGKVLPRLPSMEIPSPALTRMAIRSSAIPTAIWAS